MKTGITVLVVGLSINWAVGTAHSDDVNGPAPKRESAKPGGSGESNEEQAAVERANILASKGRAEVSKSRLPDNLARKAEFQSAARDLFFQARTIFQAEHDRQKAAYDRFDKFIPDSEKARREAREEVYVLYIHAQLNLAVVQYELAQTWDKGSTENKQAFMDAADAFERIHSRYRQQIAGLYARMWQGKCFEERNDVTKALGIYNELLGHGGDNPNKSLTTLQDRVRHFRFGCLNHEKRKDYQLVIDEAKEWLTANPEKAETRTGLGIQWEMARALKMLANSEGTSAADKAMLLWQALDAARTINRFAGEYKDSSSAMIRQLTDELNR